jgi:hypothetical protein
MKSDDPIFDEFVKTRLADRGIHHQFGRVRHESISAVVALFDGTHGSDFTTRQAVHIRWSAVY